MTERLSAALDHLDDYLHESGAIKARDAREPGRQRKQRGETRLQAIVMRHFRKQRLALQHALETLPPAKAVKASQEYDYEQFMGDDEFGVNVWRLLLEFAKDGINLFSETATIGLDYTLTNAEAAKWARKYTFDLIKGLDDTTAKALQSAITDFVQTPGATIQDIMSALPFDETRAERVAITEVTRAYAEGNQLAGEAMQEEFPDVPVVVTWYTNNDDSVCDICAPLNGKEVGIDESFTSEIDNPPAHVNCRCWVQSRTRINASTN